MTPDKNLADEILLKFTSKNMIYFDLKKFKKDYPKLYKSIIESIEFSLNKNKK
jgi:hypothetical protein